MGKITIVGLGPGEYSLISQGALDILKNSSRIYLRTEKHPIMDRLKHEIKYETLDHFYQEDEDFDNVYNNIANFIIEESNNGDLVYVVPGHPRVAEKTVSVIDQIAKEKGIETEIIASMSFVDAMFNYLAIDPAEGFKLVDAFEIENSYIDVNTSMIITQIYDRFIASNVKLALMDYYDDEQEVCIVKAAGVKNLESKKYVKLYELDRPDNDFDYLTSLYIPKSEKSMYNTVKDLENIVAELRGEGGCEWDKKQTHESLKTHIVEEAYELVQAIENDDIDEMIEELGDLLLHVVFHSQIGKEDGYFDLREVVNGICNKLVYRHPHVFSNVEVDMNTYAKTWEDLKKKEKGETTVTEGLKRIPNSLPALTKANKVQYKAALVGFDWDNIEDVFKKIVEEYKELLDEHKQGNIKYIKEELGDLLFSIVNLARFLDINPEEALNLTTEKFINRFEYIENSAISNHKNLEDMTLEEMDNLWNEAKISKK